MQAKGVALVDSLSTYSNLWHSNRSIAKQQLLTAPGDALVTAAAVCYLGPLGPAARDELFADWLRVCDGVSREPEKRLLSLSSMVLQDSRDKSIYSEPNNAGNGFLSLVYVKLRSHHSCLNRLIQCMLIFRNDLLSDPFEQALQLSAKILFMLPNLIDLLLFTR